VAKQHIAIANAICVKRATSSIHRNDVPVREQHATSIPSQRRNRANQPVPTIQVNDRITFLHLHMLGKQQH